MLAETELFGTVFTLMHIELTFSFNIHFLLN